MLVASAFAILLTWAAIAIVLIGVGSLVLQRLGSSFFLRDAFWMGLTVSVASLQIWNFLRPVDATITLLLCATGVIGLIQDRAVSFRDWKTALQSPRSLILMYLAIAFFLALRASGPCDYYDTGLYGAPAIRWIQTHPAVPGLANVHGRFGFDSSVFLFIAALSQGVWKSLGFHLFTGFVFCAIWFTLLPACFRLFRRPSSAPADWFYCILAIPVAWWTFRGPLVGSQTDEPATVACWIGAGILFEESYWKEEQGDRGGNQLRLVVAASLFALALTFKESTIVFALLAWCLAFRRTWLTDRAFANRRLCLAAALVLPAFIFLPWCLRGIVLSGYPFFPATALGLPVAWQTPPAVADWYVVAIRFWGRVPELSLAEMLGGGWFRPWLEQAIRDRLAFQAPLLISLGSLLALVGFHVRRETRAHFLWLCTAPLAATIFWFAASPIFRYGQFAIWATAGALGTWAIASVTSGPRRVQRTRIILACLSCLLIWCLISFGWRTPYERLLASRPLAPLPQPSVVARQTLSGLTVYVPAEGNQCWDAPLPCTPYFDETLRLRNSSSMRFGFTSKSRGEQLPKF